MAKKNQSEQDIEQAEVQEGAAEKEPLQLRYVGATIKHFDHEGTMYQLMPNTVYLNLPADAEQVRKLIENKELVAV